MRWLPLSLTGLWLAWGLWSSTPSVMERIEKDQKIGQIENPRKRFARSFAGLTKEMIAFDQQVQKLRESSATRVLLLTRPGWNPLVSNATYQLYPKQVIVRNEKAKPVRDLAAACASANADIVLYRTSAGWNTFTPSVK